MSGESPSTPPPRWPFAVGLVAALLDQLTKRWAYTTLYDPALDRAVNTIEVIPGFFHFHFAKNTGAAFSLFQNHPLPLTIFSVVVFCLMIVFREKLFERTRLEQWAFGLIMGGVIGNVTDRIRLQYVVDFIHWHWADRNLDWPIFNLADSFICIGVGLYMLSGLRRSKSADSE